MNVIVANRYSELINGSNIQIMKVMSGVFKVSEMVNSFRGMFYQKIIIDATALDGYPRKEVLKELATSFDTEKLILFIPPEDTPPASFLSYLVSINIYNFTDNINGVRKLVSKSNTYDDVKNYLITNTKPVVSNDFEEFTQNSLDQTNGKIILGLKDITSNNSSVVLAYILKNHLEKVYKKSVAALEIDKRDFIFYGDKDMYSIDSSKLGEFIGNNMFDILLLDLKESDNANICNDVLYLVDPSIYMINKLMFTNKRAFDALKGKKVILVNSLLSEKDVNIFAKEAGISIYFNLPPLNDREINQVLNDLLFKLGLVRNDINDTTKKGLFDFFK